MEDFPHIEMVQVLFLVVLPNEKNIVALAKPKEINKSLWLENWFLFVKSLTSKLSEDAVLPSYLVPAKYLLWNLEWRDLFWP